MRVIEPAVKELGEKFHLFIKWKAIKTKAGKAIQQLEFIFRETELIECGT